MFVAMALEREGLTENDLAPYQREMLRDLRDEPLDEEALADMLSYWRFDVPRLSERGRDYWPSVPARPRIDVSVEMTSKGNLKAEWFPRGYMGNGYVAGEEGLDFKQFRVEATRQSGYWTRPTNELMFIRETETALHQLDSDAAWRTLPLNHVLLSAAAEVVERLKGRLARHFEIRMLTDVFVEWRSEPEDPRNHRVPSGRKHQRHRQKPAPQIARSGHDREHDR